MQYFVPMATSGLRVLMVAGARPNFMKVAPVLRALGAHGHTGILVHTGQHYDVRMSDAFFRDLELPEPDYHLGVGSGSQAVQTARCMEAFEPVLREVSPDWVVVVGDVNSTLACALVTAKLREELSCGLAHVEAGLRSRDWRMPEEVNRVLTDRLADLCLTSSPEAAPNLLAEGIEKDRIVFVGNVMIDTLLDQLPAARELDAPSKHFVKPGQYAVVTLHRPSNVDEPGPLTAILRGLGRLAAEMTIVFPMHPRTRKRVEALQLEYLLAPIQVIDPVGYREMVGLVADAAVVLTDSGGLQEEATVLGVPCVTLREQTERPITVSAGTNRLVEWPITEATVVDAWRKALGRRVDGCDIPGWDGQAANRVVEALAAVMELARSGPEVSVSA
jgi:UDP-N-acetylglucosamine 2-epimerase (non-hydrolysing)